MCSVAPEHVTMLLAFGGVLLAGVPVSLLMGATYYRGVVRRAETPGLFWTCIVTNALLGGFLVGGTFLCR